MRKTNRLALVFMLVLLTGSVAVTISAMAAESESATVDEATAGEEAVLFDPFDAQSRDPFADDPFGDDPFEEETGALQTVADPLIGFNRAMFTVNDRLYFWVLKPVASGYRVVVPTPVRASIKNFFFNLLGPVRFVNCLLQGKWSAAEGEFGRFVANTTVGIVGLRDVTREYPHLNPPVEDMGQTLGHHGAGNGLYFVWPLLGPSTLRDTTGAIGDWLLNPFTFMQLVNIEAGALTSSETQVIAFGVRTVNETSFRIGDYETLKSAALDPYEALRDAYIQNRNSKIAE